MIFNTKFIILGSLIAASVSAHAANLLSNGDFESSAPIGSIASGSTSSWNGAGWHDFFGGNPAASLVAGPTYPVYGKYAAEIPSLGLIEQYVSMPKGSYTFSFDYILDPTKTNSQPKLNYYVGDILNPTTATLSATSTWQHFSKTISLSRAVSGEVAFTSALDLTHSSVAGPIVDNVSFQAVPEPSSIAVFAIGVLGLLRRRAIKK